MSDSASEIGNYYLLRKDFDNAYKYFVEAYNSSKNSSSKENIEKLLSKIDYKVYLLKNDFYEKEYLDKDMLYVASLIDKVKINLHSSKISCL